MKTLIKKKMTIYAVVVTYNPDESALIDSLWRLLPQVEKIFIVNNSEYIISPPVSGLSEKIEILELRNNQGIAKAQNLGMTKAFEDGADFVLQMDQDSFPEKRMVENLLNCYLELSTIGYQIGLVGAQDFDKDSLEKNRSREKTGTSIPNTPYFIVTETLSSGSLIPKIAFLKNGGMEEGLFIDAVDSEFCWRLGKNGFKVVRNGQALLGHRLGEGAHQILGFLNVRLDVPFRHYYQFRNVLLLQLRNYVPFKWRLINILKLLFKVVFYPFLLKDGKARLSYMLLGIADALKGKYGKMGKIYGKS